MQPFRFLLLLLALAACAPAGSPDGDATLAIGDSVMAWNGGRGIPEVVAEAGDRRVVDAAVSGARLLQERRGLAALGLDIQRQWVRKAGRWDWVIVDGGGNDLRDHCRTPREAAVLDGLISDELTGVIPDLIARIRTTGSRVVYLGYYDGAEAEPTGFSPCQGAFDVMNARLARLAARDPGTAFLDAGDVIDPARIELYDRDLIHPSPEGSRLIGEALARLLDAAG